MMESNQLTDATQPIEQRIATINASDDKSALLQCIDSCVRGTVELYRIAAACYVRLKTLDPDVQIQISVGHYLRKIAAGDMLPELMVKFEGCEKLLSKLAALDTPQQRQLMEAGSIKVMEISGTHRMVPLVDLSAKEIVQVFGPNCIRTDARQVSILKERENKARIKAAAASSDEWLADSKRGGIIHNGSFLPTRKLLDLVGELTR